MWDGSLRSCEISYCAGRDLLCGVGRYVVQDMVHGSGFSNATYVGQVRGLTGCRRKVQEFADGVEVGANPGLVGATTGTAFKIQKQGLHDLPAIGIANRLQRRAASECGHLMVNPVLGLPLDGLLKPPLCLWIAQKSALEFVILLRLCLGSFGSFREH